MKEQTTNLKREQEKQDILEQASQIAGYDEWKIRLAEVLSEKKRRAELFDLCFLLISKFQSMTLFQMSIVTGLNMRGASRLLKEWRLQNKVILLTDQFRGHKFIIKVKA